MRWFGYTALLLVGVAGCGKKNVTEQAAPIVGWHTEEGWSGECWFPPDWEALEAAEGISARKLMRQTALEAMVKQWAEQGFSEMAVENSETTLLGYPDKIEGVSVRNLGFCKQVRAGGGAGEWSRWVSEMSATLTAGLCITPLVDTWFDYLEIGNAWQLQVPICQGQVASITATESDKYRVTKDGEWINATGLTTQSTSSDTSWPCSLEGCVAGMVIGRFRGDSGVENIFPIGLATTFTAPEHGTLSVGINDTTFYDNTWFKSGGITDRTGITISPEQ